MWSGWVQGNSDGLLAPMVRLVPIEKDVIPMVLLVSKVRSKYKHAMCILHSISHASMQNKFAFTLRKNALIVIMNITCSII